MSNDALSKIKRSSQTIDNLSFDEAYLQSAVLLLTENEAGTAIGRQKEIATEETLQTIVHAIEESTLTAMSVDAVSPGDNIIVAITNTPKLYYISLSANGANSTDVTATVKIGLSSKYKVSLKAGAIWARNIGAGRKYLTGSVGDDIIVNLSTAQTVHVSVEYADV